MTKPVASRANVTTDTCFKEICSQCVAAVGKTEITKTILFIFFENLAKTSFALDKLQASIGIYLQFKERS